MKIIVSLSAKDYPAVQMLASWVAKLQAAGFRIGKLTERQYFPRAVVGAYFEDVETFVLNNGFVKERMGSVPTYHIYREKKGPLTIALDDRGRTCHFVVTGVS